jgi:acetylglutamate kinase
VVAPIGIGPKGETYNINADTVAGALAKAVEAAKLVMLTDIAGVMDGNGELISRMTPAQVRAMIASGEATGGMIPKLETCLDYVSEVDGAAHILDGRLAHAVLLEIFTEHGTGTMIE